MGRRPGNLYAVEWQDNSAKPHTTLVAANTHAYALRAVEEDAPDQVVQQPTVRRLHTGDPDGFDSATIVWSGGRPPEGR
ncbi:hypothetical protein [Nonomuraea maritima]|uniref:hypothetical protein n=1 Tax=Nonomuraea maritima TaxID=683260 RepID=UPI003714DFAA